MSLEKRLLKARQAGNREKINRVFEEVFNEYSKLVAFIIFKYVSQKEDVEDLVMDVFLKVFRESLRTEIGNIKSYLVMTAKNASVDFLRKQEVVVDYNDEVLLDLADDRFEKGNDYYELVDSMKKVLNEREINIILLHVIYGYSFKEIGSRYAVPEATVKTVYHRAVKKFRKEV